MSSSDSAPGRREVAYRLFAAEFDDAELSYSESDEERAPNYVVTPTGARVNRLFAVGVLTEVEDVNPEMVRGRVVDPTGVFVTYAGQYQPDSLAFLERVESPAFLALTGKARTYEPDDGDRIYTSVRPETVSQVDSATRDRWVVTTAERTLERIGIVAAAIESGLVGDRLRAALIDTGVDERLADGVALALEYYGTTPEYLQALRKISIDAVAVVAGQREEVGRLDLAPGDGAGDPSALSTLDLSDTPSTETTATAADVSASSGSDVTDESRVPTQDPDSGTSADSGEMEEGTLDSTTGTGAETGIDPESRTDATADTSGTGDAGADGTSESVDVTDVQEGSLDDFDPAEFELDEEERREVEAEYGTEFSTASEVESLGEIDSSDSDPDGVGATADSDTAPDAEAPAETVAETDSESAPESAPESAQELGETDAVNVEDAVMEVMERLDDGDGADRDDLIAEVVKEYGHDAEAVEAAIQDALMGGRCYEPSDGKLKSI